MNILFLRAGIFSYVNNNLLRALQRHHAIIDNVDAGRVIRRRSLCPTSWFNLVGTFIFSKQYWRQTHSKNSFAFKRMTEFCNRFVNARDDYDIIFQTQCKFSITSNPHQRPYYIFTDLTQQLTEQVWPKWSIRSTKKERARWLWLETEAFHRATKIFTFNEYIKTSFIHDYGLDEKKIVIVGSGVNSADWADVDIASKRDHELVLLFLCTEFERQGGPTILNAFDFIRRKLPRAKLIIGGNSPVKSSEGIEVHKNPSNLEIEGLFNRARIFLSPGHLGGVQSVLEAMSKKCVCIVSESNFLLYDIVENDSTGITVPLNDAQTLAEKIIELHRDPDRAEKIAMAGYEHARANFSWDTVVKKMACHFSPNNQVA